MTREIWKDIPGYEGRYQASSLGRIRSVDHQVFTRNHYTGNLHPRTVRGRVLRPGPMKKDGHLSVVLGHKANGSLVHRLVARTFIGPCPKGMEVCHNDGNPTNNRIENLRYDTRGGNIRDDYRNGARKRKLTNDEILYIRFAHHVGIPLKRLADAYGISYNTAYKMYKGEGYEDV